MKRPEFQDFFEDLSWLRDRCRSQFEVTEFFEQCESGVRLRDLLNRVDRMDFETLHFPVLKHT